MQTKVDRNFGGEFHRGCGVISFEKRGNSAASRRRKPASGARTVRQEIRGTVLANETASVSQFFSKSNDKLSDVYSRPTLEKQTNERTNERTNELRRDRNENFRLLDVRDTFDFYTAQIVRWNF